MLLDYTINAGLQGHLLLLLLLLFYHWMRNDFTPDDVTEYLLLHNVFQIKIF